VETLAQESVLPACVFPERADTADLDRAIHSLETYDMVCCLRSANCGLDFIIARADSEITWPKSVEISVRPRVYRQLGSRYCRRRGIGRLSRSITLSKIFLGVAFAHDLAGSWW